MLLIKHRVYRFGSNKVYSHHIIVHLKQNTKVAQQAMFIGFSVFYELYTLISFFLFFFFFFFFSFTEVYTDICLWILVCVTA